MALPDDRTVVRTRKGVILQDRFPLALGLSLLIHLLILLVPAGRGGLSILHRETAPGTAMRYAPLDVVLAPYTVQAPRQIQPEPRKVREEARTAAAIETRGQDVGTRGGEEESISLAAHDPVAISGIVLPHYYPPEELTRRASIVRDLDPQLGGLADVPGVGKAILRLWINEAGGVDRVETESSTLQEVFAQAVSEGFLAARFQPAEREGVPVKSLMRIEVEVLPRSRFSRNAATENSPSP